MSEPHIVHQPDAQRWVLDTEGHRAVLEYVMHGPVLRITHTGVPAPIGGRGIAARLVRAAFEHARQAGLQVDPACSYARVWAQRHPEFLDIVV